MTSKYVAIVAFVLSMCASLGTTSVMAQTASSASTSTHLIYLKCIPGDRTANINLVIDLTNNTINHEPATIDATTMRWKEQGGGSTYVSSSVTSFHLDRVTGTLTTFERQFLRPGYYNYNTHANENDFNERYDCNVTGVPKTKF